jgi:hypothetical protein
MKNVIIISAIVVSGLLVRGIAHNVSSPDTNYTLSPSAERRAFVLGCTDSGAVNEEGCGCMYDSLTAKYGSTYIRDNATRFSKGDITDEEYDIIRTCV